MSSYFPPPESRGGWRTAFSPTAAHDLAGLDLPTLERAWDVAAALHDDSSLLVARHGWLAFERYQGAVTPQANRNLHSCGKAFTATAAGILIAERPDLFPLGLAQPVYSATYLPPEHQPLRDERKRAIQLGHLLSHTAGLRGRAGTFVGPDGAQDVDPSGPDGRFPEHVAFGHAWWDYMDTPTTLETLWCDPGAAYSYASAGPIIAGALVRHLSGQPLDTYLAQRVFDPIGWESWEWQRNPPEPSGTAHVMGQGGIAPRPRDALRFGYLHLRGGQWDGRQLVPAAHAAAMRLPSPFNPCPIDYGLQVRLNALAPAPRSPRDAYGPVGYANNFIIIVPSLDLVAVRIGHRYDAQQRRDAWPVLLDAVAAAVSD